MKIIGCDFHPSFQQIAMVETETGEQTERRITLAEAPSFYRSLAGPVRVGMEACGNTLWFERLLAEHEHQRDDRDRFVIINFQNIDLAVAVGNFSLWPGPEIHETDYDFLSVMHYANNAGGQIDPNTRQPLLTIQPQPQFSQFLNLMGRGTHLSALDERGIGAIYPPNALQGCIDHVAVHPAPNNPVSIQVGTTTQLVATAFDRGNNPLPIVRFDWLSVDPTIATVDSRGLVSGVAAGSSAVVATVTGVTNSPIGSTNVTVVCSTNCGSGSSGGTRTSGGNGGTGTTGGTVGSNGAASSTLSTFTGTVVGPQDPNDKAGSQGVGTAQYIAGQTPLRYALFFGNEPTASAPAQKVVVSDQLNLSTDDLSTFSLGPIALTNQLVIPPSGLSDYSTIADLRPGNNILVALNAHLDTSTGLLTWTFQSLDPATNQPPADSLAGFLRPGIGGSTFFTVMAKTTVPTDTEVQNNASVVFDTNPSISTPTWLNTIDKDAPLSHMFALPPQSPTNIPLHWAGIDVGAGVQDFTVYVSDNGGPFTPFVTQSTAISAAFAGQPGHTYGFFSTARDFVGNVEDLKTTAETTTTVVTDAISPTTVAVLAPLANANGWNNSDVSISLSSTDNPGGSGVQQITFSATGAQPTAATNVPGTSASALIGTEGITNFSFFATDLAGNVETAHPLVVKLDKTPPSITGSRSPAANANGWSNTDVTVSFACSDALSGLAPGSPPRTRKGGTTRTSQPALPAWMAFPDSRQPVRRLLLFFRLKEPISR
jgi:hypothetical protein